MFYRCEGKYKPKGTVVCPEWEDFDTFCDWALASGFKIGLTLDRIKNDGNYEPSNCQWIPKGENSRKRDNVTYITCFGETKTAGQWSEEVGVKETTIIMRIKAGWTEEEALTINPDCSRHQKVLDRVLIHLKKINVEVTELKWDDSRYAAILIFSTGFQRSFKIKGMAYKEVLDEISQYLIN